MIGKYERGEAVLSIEAAKKIADALGVPLDYLVGEEVNSKLDKHTLDPLQDLELLDDNKKKRFWILLILISGIARLGRHIPYKRKPGAELGLSFYRISDTILL